MARQGYDLQLTRYDEKGWRATFYTSGMEHSITSATASAWERTPWHAVQRRFALAGSPFVFADLEIRRVSRGGLHLYELPLPRINACVNGARGGAPLKQHRRP